MATDIIQPNNNNNNNDNKNKNNIKTPSKSSSTSPTTTATRTDPTSTSSSTHTSSSRRSLASFRSSLGDSPHLYDISEIRTATNNFLSKKGTSPSHNNSSSWRCTLHGKDVIIFQRRSQNQQNLIPNNIRRKLSSLCRSHHVAIVNLIGASISGDYIYLVYDFVRGASLYDLLHNKNNPGFTILNTWMSRVQVASDLASGLDYIHNNCTSLDVTFVHNHVKSSSVIVTEPSFGARLCHFGVSELCGESTEDVRGNFGRNGAIDEIVEEDAGVGTTSFRTLNRSNSVKFNGTMGYMSPEFQATGVGTRKSDVYAFGVVLIELLSGEEPVKYKLDKATREYRKISAIDNAISVIDNDAGGGERDGRIRQWIDRRLRDSYPIDVAEKLTRLAVECVHTDPDKRPDMRRVAGKISKLYLESHVWCDKMSVPTDFTVSFAAR